MSNWEDGSTLKEQEYQKYLAGKNSHMTQERIDQLNSVGFEWDTAQKASWDQHYEALREYKQLHGDCRVPQSHVNLGNWVRTQRTQYKKWQDGQHSNMTQERID